MLQNKPVQPVQAEWKPFERESLGQRLVGFLKELKVWQWLFAILTPIVIFLLQEATAANRHESILAPLALAPLFFLICLRFVTIGRSSEPSPALRKMLRSERGFPVNMSIFLDGTIAGEDEGVVRFDDGAFHYTGLHTSFRLTPQDVNVPEDAFASGPLLQAKAGKLPFGNLAGDRAWGFLLAEHRECRLYFFPLGSSVFKTLGTTGAGGLYQSMFEWLRDKPQAEGPTILPPLTTMPNYRPPWPPAGKKPATPNNPPSAG